MIGSLSRHHHGNSGRLDNARIVRTDRLLFDDRYPLSTVVPSDPGSPLGPNPTVFRTAPNLFEHLKHEIHVTECALADLH